jgi:hypothetical protein
MLGRIFAAPPEVPPPPAEDTAGVVVQLSAARGYDEGGATARSMLEQAIQRLCDVVDQETDALRKRTAVDLKVFNERKSHGLLELNRALRLIDGAATSPAVTGQLATLRAKLEVNQAVLRMHLEAVREVSAILADAIRDQESDGTYSPTMSRGNRLP